MATSTTIINTRRFIVKGQLECIFTPNITNFVEEISNLEIELWQKSPLNIYLLGKGSTDQEGNFVIEFEVNDDTAYLTEGRIDDVFAKVYYNQAIISGENPYTDDESAGNRPIKNITLQEGVTDIGSKQIEITRFEYPTGTSTVKILEKPIDSLANILFDIREASSGRPLPVGTSCAFRAFLELDSNELDIFDSSLLTIKEGYAELSTAPFPCAIKKDKQDFIINTHLNGIPASPSEQCYLGLHDFSDGTYYTPVTNLIIHEGKFTVYSAGIYYPIADLPDGLSGISTVSITDNGRIGMYDSGTGFWSMSSQLTFYKFQFPENLEVISDGIYAASGSLGTIISGYLGSEDFSDFSLTMDSKGFFPINVEVSLTLYGKEPFFSESFYSLLPGDPNLVMVETSDFPQLEDSSPDLSQIETVSGTIFTTAFVDFLNSKNLTTIDKLKRAGPLRYISDFPATGTTVEEVALLQAHIDLFSINKNTYQNQHLIDEGYGDLYKIAETPKDIFLNAVETPVLPLYFAANLHETALQTQKLVTNLLSAKMGDYDLALPAIPDLPDSSFANTAFSKFINRCECEDCTSAVSPFSYLVDLIKYGAKHIKKTGTPAYSPVNYGAFMALLENYFFQPFGSFNVDCDTLHREYCRMRLVTEILENYVATKTLPAAVLLRLENDRKNFILLTYKTILTKAGTSYEELRSIIAIQDENQKIAAAQRLSDKLGVPLYDPTTSVLVAEVMWLTVSNTLPSNELNAENLESIFGFRNTERNILSNLRSWKMAEWKQAYLFDLWKSTDFLFSAYSREDVDPNDDNTFKAEWKPIIDPDSFGRSDMTYQSSDFALALWRHRKADTDTFLNYFVSDDNILSRTSVDMRGRRLRVLGKNLKDVQFLDKVVRLKNPTSTDYDKLFNIFDTDLSGTSTIILLKQSTSEVTQEPLFQPEEPQPMMRYDSVLNVIDPIISETSTEIILNWTEAVIHNYLDISTDGVVQLISTGQPTEIYTTSNGSIVDVEIDHDLDSVVLTLNITPSAGFIAGDITFIYTAEVALDTTTVPDPEIVSDKLFEHFFNYTYLSPPLTTPFAYTTWDEPTEWPDPIDSEPTNYLKLKKLYQIIRLGTTNVDYLDIVTTNLHTNLYGFNLVMETLISCEQYLSSMYSYDKPDAEKCFQMSSVFRSSARQKLNENWVKEEIKHIPSGGTDPEELMLDSRYFWKALNEPSFGPWNGSLQTIPADVLGITASNIPIIDPELVPRQRLLTSPDAEEYRDLYDLRQLQLDHQRSIYLSWLTSYEPDGFIDILNHINTGDENINYDISPYVNLNALILDFESTDEFSQLKANTVLQEAFALTPDGFSVILPVMRAYQSEDPSSQPSIAELRSVADLFVTACKRKQFYFTGLLGIGWIEEEITEIFPNGQPVKYYNVLDMQLDSILGNILNRSEWQRTLVKWNRVPTIFPDIVPPENIKSFVQGEVVHDLWVDRKNQLDSTYDQFATEFNETFDAEILFNKFNELLSVLIARSRIIPTDDYSSYFIVLFEKEDGGEDIRPALNQLNILITEYRLLKQVYGVLKNESEIVPIPHSNLLPSEYDDVINICIRVNFANAGYFSYVQQEYYENIVLSGTDFQNYSPSIINFPLNLAQEPVQWRSPNADKKAWKDTLNTRIDSEQSTVDEWETVIEETEDITMHVMRDALIQALRNACESLEDTAERLAKTLFIETKDNCCMKHSRVSHAIETLQGFIFSLESGIYDNYLNGFTLTAPNFDKEWEWLGSYATWRSAIFTYIYPENLLYPTLKRRQSPAFIELSETIQNANRFTALNACQAAKKYQQYFEDIQNLKLVCTANAYAYIFKKDPLDCCGDMNNNIRESMTFYIAQSASSGKGYYSEKPYNTLDSDEHDFWKVIPTLPENAKIIGCLPLNRDYDDNGQAIGTSLWLFYTYTENGKFKLCYLKKDLMKAGSEWSDEEETSLPDLLDIKYKKTVVNTSRTRPTSNDVEDFPILDFNDKLISVTICQHSVDWDFVFFVFSYKRSDGTQRHVHIRYMAQDDFFDEVIGSMLFFDNNSSPLTAIRHHIRTNVANANELIGITVVFENEIQTGFYGNFSGNDPVPPKKRQYTRLIGAFKSQSNEKFVLAQRPSGETNYLEVYYTYTLVSGKIQLNVQEETLNVSEFDKSVRSIAPRYNSSIWETGNAVTAYNNNILVGVRYLHSINSLSSSVIFSLAPEKVTTIEPIESGDCIENFNIRSSNIKGTLRANLNAPQGNPVGTFYRTSAVKEVLYEAYYFVPMLIALDQQHRGDYPTALDWYRSVYDYTNNLSNKRKVFYGLVLEQTITNVFDRPADWLLDPLNPHLIAKTRVNAYTKYTLMNIIQCMISYGDREFTSDTIETVPNARKLYTEALSLLKVSELNMKPSRCYTKSHNCFQTGVSAPVDVYWNNSFDELQNELGSLNDVLLIEEASVELIEIMNSETTSMVEKFTLAFSYLSAFKRIPRPIPVSNRVSLLIDGIGDRMNNAYRYLFAELDTRSFNTSVSDRFGQTIAKLTSMTPDEVPLSINAGNIEWMKLPVRDNAQPMDFSFINAEGIQLLKNEYAFNPLNPTSDSVQRNLVFTNATILYEPFLYAESYVPYVDYAFCLPSNPIYSGLELKGNLELFKIHNCRNIAGMERSLDIFAAPTDSVTGVPIIGAGGNLILPSTAAIIPSQYRFRVLIERAKQLVSQAQQLEGQFLSILEKEDAENYSQLRARQDLQTAKATVKLQDLRVKQSELEKEVADLQLTKVQFIQANYNNLIASGMNAFENAQIDNLKNSIIFSTTASAIGLTGATGVAVDPRSSAASVLDVLLSSLNAASNLMSSLSSLNAQLASYSRRAEEWQYQSDLAGYDISIANQQIKIAEQNTRIVSQEREIASLNMGHATDTLEFLKTKFTNAELYRWMGNILERTYSYMLSLATATAKIAERQYYFEQQQQAGPFIMDDYWEVPQTGSLTTAGGTDRRGMTGSARLLQDITKLDQHAFDTTKRKLEMTKVISIGQLYPDAFQTFIETGTLNFNLTDRLFDYDFPGHYLRLINGVKVSVVGLIPVYDNIKATLTTGNTSYTVINANNTFQRIPIRRLETEQVALTGASRATGVFEFQQQQGELLNPFEGTGIESGWEFKMPRFSNRMDYSNVADVLIEVDYTALDSFIYRYQVLQEIDNTLEFSRGFSFKNDYPDQWYELQQATEDTPEFSIDIEINRNQFPQGIDNIRLDGTDMILHFVRKDGFTEEVNIADFNIVTSASSTDPMSGTTVGGTFSAVTLTRILEQTVGAPFVKLRLTFNNSQSYNRELFSKGDVTDIMLLIKCKADLPAYPL